ncbi:MAG TPA: hypothetical protein VE597_07980 [Geminicoccaceae bacterium]|jgi:hypothetical protein|nr:hypothetical protein [Geminicoccaceae bacterium]
MQSLKDANQRPLLLIVVANSVTFYLAVKTDALLGGQWLVLAKNVPEVLPVGLCLVLVEVVNAQLSSDAKARIVFLRWQDPLPGSEAFTRHAIADPRINLTAIERNSGPLPTSPRQQNFLWYRLYRSVAYDPAVLQVHREYLFTRDYACLCLLMLIGLGTAGLFHMPSRSTALGYAGLLTIQFLLVRRAARNHGVGLVTTVLALKGAEN